MKSDKFEKISITKKSKNIPRWYTDVIQKAEIADYGPVRGTMVIRPYGYAMWERVKSEFDKLIKKFGVENAYFPLFIPMSLLKREKEHVEGFSPELAVVTHGGGKKLAEPLAVRPTSETVMYESYSKWISSWRDLPIKINQWNNIVRWEKRTYFFLRTLEFLWQEGHTAHATYDEAEEMVLNALNSYEKIYKELFALPCIVGEKSETEKFAGALHTYSVEILMPDGKILQAATSHNLGQNFSKVFDISFQNEEGKTEFVWQTSWGLSTRSLGGMFLVHGDDNGLVVPPKIAPIKAVVIPILGKNDEKIIKYSNKVVDLLSKHNSKFLGEVKIWDDPEKSYGWKVNEAELKGIPVFISIGSREMQERTITLTDRLGIHKNKLFKLEDAPMSLDVVLKKLQRSIYDKAKADLAKNIKSVKTYDEFKEIMKSSRSFVKAFWCGDKECERKIKEETKATTRVKCTDCSQKGKCVYCGKPGDVWYFGQSY